MLYDRHNIYILNLKQHLKKNERTKVKQNEMKYI